MEGRRSLHATRGSDDSHIGGNLLGIEVGLEGVDSWLGALRDEEVPAQRRVEVEPVNAGDARANGIAYSLAGGDAP